MNELTHLDELGHVRMVDVTDKADTDRWALARGTVRMTRKTFDLIARGQVTKGNVLETARIAGIQAAKKTWDLIPMCHPLFITYVRIDFTADDQRPAIHIAAEVRVKGPTGVEMEALTAVTTAALTIYDMCKSIDKFMVISDIRLEEKTGGKSGHFIRDAHETP